MTRVYIAGPMTGLADLNFPAFDAEAERLRAEGIDVINPAEINGADCSWEECMRRDIGQLVHCTRIHLLPGWESSAGASLKYRIACAIGMEITHAPAVIPLLEAA